VPTGSVTLSDGQGGTCSIDPLTLGTTSSGGNCAMTESAISSPYTITATYSGDSYYNGTATSITIATGVSSAGTASTGTAGVATSATGGADGDLVTETGYASDPVGAPSFSAAGEYFDVELSSGNSFMSDTIVDCNLSGGGPLEWWDPSANMGGGGWALVVGDPGPTLLATNPPCVSITLDNSTTPNLSQLTGTVFAVVKMGITTRSLPLAVRGEAYSAHLTALGGNAPYDWTILAGSLPKGLHLKKSTGVISGKPKMTDSGTSTFTVKVIDKKTKKTPGHPSTQNTATSQLSITIS
jgi:hypothetical protein